MLERERVALAHLRASFAQPEIPEAPGYRFFWVRDGRGAALLVAAPEERGKDGVRWFATADGEEIYEYDTIVFPAPEAGPIRG